MYRHYITYGNDVPGNHLTKKFIQVSWQKLFSFHRPSSLISINFSTYITKAPEQFIRYVKLLLEVQQVFQLLKWNFSLVTKFSLCIHTGGRIMVYESVCVVEKSIFTIEPFQLAQSTTKLENSPSNSFDLFISNFWGPNRQENLKSVISFGIASTEILLRK